MINNQWQSRSYFAPAVQSPGSQNGLVAPATKIPMAKCILPEEASCQTRMAISAIPTPARSLPRSAMLGCANGFQTRGARCPVSPVSKCTSLQTPRGPRGPPTPRGASASWIPPRITPQQSWKPMAQVVGVSEETCRLPVAQSHSWVPPPTPRCEFGGFRSWMPPLANCNPGHHSTVAMQVPTHQAIGRHTQFENLQNVPPLANNYCPSSPTSKAAKPFSYCPSLVIDQRLEGSPLRGCQTMIAAPDQLQTVNMRKKCNGLPHCVSLVAPVYSAIPKKREQETLRMASAFNSRQHPAKNSTGIPNADAVLEGIDYVGIADGVSGVRALGLTPDALPWELLHSCGSGLFAASAKGEPKTKSGKHINETHSDWMIHLIQEAFDSTEEYGATTLLLAAIKGSNLVTACLGDSAILILRPVSYYPLRLQPIFKTEPGRYDARRPVQIQRLHGCDVASAHEVISSANVATTPVMPGDFLVLGTDGLFDNLSDVDIQKVLEKCCQATGSNEELSEASSLLVDLAIRSVRLGEDNADKPPWQSNAASVPANNADDTTALVAMIKADVLPELGNTIGGLRELSPRRGSQRTNHANEGLELSRATCKHGEHAVRWFWNLM